jgi:ABC-2 type transport system ATP-binding protein
MRIEARNLDKHFRSVHAVKDLSFTVEPGRVTGFLGPNGSGKSTTMRLMLGLDNGGGETLYDGKKLSSHFPVTKTIGAHLDAKFFHPKRTAYAHLRMLGAEAGISKARVHEVLKLVGLESVAKKRPGGFSLGMGQRLGLAGAILADPQVLMLDEPAGGLVTQDIVWMNALIKYLSVDMYVLLVEHHMDVVMSVCSKLYVLNFGEVIASGDAETVRRDPAVMAAYLGTGSNHVA